MKRFQLRPVYCAWVRSVDDPRDQFRKLYLSPFDEAQIKKYLSRRFPGFWNRRRRKLAEVVVRKVPALSVRPMLLSHMQDILSSAITVSEPVDVYKAMVQAWLERERAWADPTALINFSEELATDLFTRRVERGGEFARSDEIVRLARAWNVKLDDHLLTSRSLLNRTAAGNFKFAHRSIMEYLVAESILRPDGGIPKLRLTDQMAEFVLQRLGCWSREATKFLTGLESQIIFEEVQLKLGMATNYSLFTIAEDLDVASVEMMKTRAHSRGVLSDVIVAALESAPGSQSRVPLEVRIRFDSGALRARSAQAHVTIWSGSMGLLATMDFDSSGILAALAIGQSEERIDRFLECESEFVGKRGADSSVSEMKWDVRTRVRRDQLRDLIGLPIPISMLQNYGCGYVYSESRGLLEIRLLNGCLYSVGKYAPFGILSDISAERAFSSGFAVLTAKRLHGQLSR